MFYTIAYCECSLSRFNVQFIFFVFNVKIILNNNNDDDNEKALYKLKQYAYT